MAFNEYFVRNTNGADVAGQGMTHATAYKTIQFAIDDVAGTHGTNIGGNRDRFNLCDESPFVLTAQIANMSYPISAWAVLQGYTTTPADGGRFDVDLNAGAYSFLSGSASYWAMADGCVHNNTGNNPLLDLAGVAQKVLRMELYDCSYRAIDGSSTNGASVEQCYIHDIDGTGIHRVGRVFASYLRNGATKKFGVAIEAYRGMCDFNVVVVDGGSDGIYSDAYQQTRHNAVISLGGTGTGITRTLYMSDLSGNVVEGFSGSGGVGIASYNSTTEDWHQGNACYNNETNYKDVGDIHIIDDAAADNEVLPSSGFAKAGSLPTDMSDPDFWSDLYSYFAPNDVGNMLAGYPSSTGLLKGPVQIAPSVGGSTLIVVED